MCPACSIWRVVERFATVSCRARNISRRVGAVTSAVIVVVASGVGSELGCATNSMAVTPSLGGISQARVWSPRPSTTASANTAEWVAALASSPRFLIRFSPKPVVTQKLCCTWREEHFQQRGRGRTSNVSRSTAERNPVESAGAGGLGKQPSDPYDLPTAIGLERCKFGVFAAIARPFDGRVRLRAVAKRRNPRCRWRNRLRRLRRTNPVPVCREQLCEAVLRDPQSWFGDRCRAQNRSWPRYLRV